MALANALSGQVLRDAFAVLMVSWPLRSWYAGRRARLDFCSHMGLDNPLHIAFLVVILLLVFGARRLPEIGRSLGTGMREFKDSVTGPSRQHQQQPALTAGDVAAPAAARTGGAAGTGGQPGRSGPGQAPVRNRPRLEPAPAQSPSHRRPRHGGLVAVAPAGPGRRRRWPVAAGCTLPTAATPNASWRSRRRWRVASSVRSPSAAAIGAG